MQIIRKTQSVCPKCIKKINADIIEEKRKIFMLKKCKDHGEFRVEISNNSLYYKELNDMYFAINNPKKTKNLNPFFVKLYVTSRCNLNCPVCYANVNKDNHYNDLSLRFIKDKIKNCKNKSIALIGGEPTIREDLPDLIKIIRRYSNTPILFTNGVKISNFDYLKELKDAGLAEVRFQFDGFSDEIYKKIRGMKLSKIKKQALENLKKLNIPITLELTIAKGINTHELKEIFEYAVKNDFIRGIDFKSYCYEGAKGVPHNRTLNSWDIIDIIEKETKGGISLKKVVEFQKPLYWFFDFLSLRRCFNNLLFCVFRTKEGYKPIGSILNFHKIQKHLDKAKELRLKNKKFKSYFYLLYTVLPRVLGFRSFPFIWMALSIYFKKIFFNKLSVSSATNKKSLALLFGGGCDPYTFDFQSVVFCNSHQITDKDSLEFGYSNILREKR